MTISELLLPEFDTEMASTRKMLAVVPEAKFGWKPHEKSMTLGRLATHVAELPTWGKTTLEQDAFHMKSGEFKPVNAETTAQLLEIFEKNAAEARALLAATPDEKWFSSWEMTYDGKPVMKGTKYQIFRGTVVNHIVHHRAQISVFLRLLEVEIPGMYGPSADEMKYWT